MSAEIFGASDVASFLEENESRMYELVPEHWIGTAMASFYMPDERCLRAVDRKMRDIIKCGFVDVHSTMEDGRSALHLLAEFGYSRSVEALVQDRGVSVEQTDSDGRTPLMWAAAAGMGISTVRSLISLGASVRAIDNNKRTPLHYAAMSGSGAITELLLSGADPVAADSRGHTPIHYACISKDCSLACEILSEWIPHQTRAPSSSTVERP